MATPYDTIRLGSVASTQDVAREAHAERGPVLVVADRQLGGRGRSGSEWWEAPRAMYSSLAFVPEWAASEWGVLPLVAGLAVRTALGDRFACDVGLKWPNDLVTAAGKVGGILVEASGGLVVVGCGVNLWWPEAPPSAAAVADDDPGPEAAPEVAAAWAAALLERLERGPGRWGRDEYLAACVTVGQIVEWSTAEGITASGEAVGVNEKGALIVATRAGQAVVQSGEVRHVRSATLPADAAPEGDAG